MKATGIVRRIDDLGRIVIPKEIRRTLRIYEGSPLEIFTESDGSITFKKYSRIGALAEAAEKYTEALFRVLGQCCLVCDTERVIAAAGTGKKDMAEKNLTEKTIGILMKRKPYEEEFIGEALENFEKKPTGIYPIVCDGDVMGGVMYFGTLKSETKELLKFTAALLGNMSE